MQERRPVFSKLFVSLKTAVVQHTNMNKDRQSKTNSLRNRSTAAEESRFDEEVRLEDVKNQLNALERLTYLSGCLKRNWKGQKNCCYVELLQ